MQEEFQLTNISEELIEMFIDDCMKSMDMCTCARCRADVMAFALNQFGPRYVVTDAGGALMKALSLSNQFQADIITAIMQGAILVRESPRHGDYEMK